MIWNFWTILYNIQQPNLVILRHTIETALVWNSFRIFNTLVKTRKCGYMIRYSCRTANIVLVPVDKLMRIKVHEYSFVLCHVISRDIENANIDVEGRTCGDNVQRVIVHEYSRKMSNIHQHIFSYVGHRWSITVSTDFNFLLDYLQSK